MNKNKNTLKFLKNKNIEFKNLFFILFTLGLLILALILVHFYLKEEDHTKIPVPGADVIRTVYRTGEVCEINNEQNPQGFIVFNEVVIANEIEGEGGSFLVLSGEIDTDGFSFLINDVNSFYLDIMLWEHSGDVESHFSEELSQKLSDAELKFNGECGAMRGKFSLVFSIEERDLEIIKSELSGPLKEETTLGVMTLKVGFDKSRYSRLFFRFTAADIKYN